MFINQVQKVIFFHIPKTGGRSMFKAFGFYEGNDIRLSHFLPAEAKHCIFRETWDDYWKFTVVRNPWDRYVSLYEFQRQNEYVIRFNYPAHSLAKSNDFKTWMFLNYNKFATPSFGFAVPQSAWWGSMNQVYKFEELPAAVEDIQNHIPLVQPFGKENSSVHAPFQSYYTKGLIDIVAKIEHETIERFGYKFE